MRPLPALPQAPSTSRTARYRRSGSCGAAPPTTIRYPPPHSEAPPGAAGKRRKPCDARKSRVQSRLFRRRHLAACADQQQGQERQARRGFPIQSCVRDLGSSRPDRLARRGCAAPRRRLERMACGRHSARSLPGLRFERLRSQYLRCASARLAASASSRTVVLMTV